METSKAEFELYHYGESLCAQMVRIALAEKGIPYKSHAMLLNEIAMKADNLTPEYLAINPHGIVPTLIHKGRPIFDSWEIIKYLDHAHPNQGPDLWPNDPSEQTEMDVWVSDVALRDDAKVGRTLGTAIPILSAPIIQKCLKRQPFFHVMWKFRKHPRRDRAALFRLLRIRGLPRGLSARAVKTIARGLLRIEGQLAKSGPFLLGEFSQIDVMMMAHFHRMEDVALGDIFASPHVPNLNAYWQRLKQRPSYKEAILDWHEDNWRATIAQIWNGRPSAELPALEKALAQEVSGLSQKAA